MKKILLIGGSNIDYIGTSNQKLIGNVSNLGVVSTSFGGVMRNTAEDLSRIGNHCLFLTTIGNDVNGQNLLNNLKELNIETYYPKTEYSQASYLAINNNDHDMALAICDNRIMEDLNIAFINKYRGLISSSEYVALDSNVADETVDYLLTNFDVKFICEAISPQRVVKYKKNLNRIYLLKCNIHEAQALTETNLEKEELVQKLFGIGANNVVVTCGSKDIYYGTDKKEIGHVKVDEVKDYVNTTGCGDAMFAGIIDKVNQGKSLKEAIEFGKKLSELTLQTNKACSDKLTIYAYEHEEDINV